MKNLSIKKKLIYGLIILISILSITGIIEVANLKKIAIQNEKIFQHPFPVSNSVREIEGHINAMHRSMKDVSLSKNEEELNTAIAQVNEEEKTVYECFDVVLERFLGNKDDVNNALAAFKAWKPIRDEVIFLKKQGKDVESADITKGKGADHVKLLLKNTQFMIGFAGAKAKEFKQNTASLIQKSYSGLLLTIIASIIISFFISLWIVRSTHKPLDRITSRIRKLSTKYYEEDIFHSDDKIAILESAVDELEKSNQELVESKSQLEKLVKERTRELRLHQKNLELTVNERTAELSEKNAELEKFNQLFIGREMRIKELKEELKKYRT